MGLGDRIRAFFSKRGNPQLTALDGFLATRKGIEGYIEPRTATQPTTLLLVDRDGDHARAPVREPEDAVRFCEAKGIPIYDAAIIGYPRRMKEFDARRRGEAPVGEAFDRAFEDLEKRFNEDPGDTPKD